MAEALRQQVHTPRVYLRFFPMEAATKALLDPSFCQENEVIAFERQGNLVCVAFSNPNRRELVDEIAELAGQEIKVFQAPWEDIRKELERE